MYLTNSRERIEQEFNSLCGQYPELLGGIQRQLEKYATDTRLALQYLYLTMPVSDRVNYPLEFFYDYAMQGVFLWDSCVEKGIPEDIYLNYVLSHRVNTEEITPCRSFFYEQLKDRVAGLSMKEAVLETNYWCAEEATYQATDDRTVAPMTVYRSGYGRCGEESVFTVSALRSIGIPARQVYAPRWSHCDDNHAWVEAWCDGQWYFLGACEPEQILNRGWFTNASSRAMLIHSRWYDTKSSDEDVIVRNGVVTELNQLNRYAHTKRVKVRVTDENGLPVSNAQVDFEILNYSEFYKAASIQTDADGEVSLLIGLGSIHICASKLVNGEQLSAEYLLDARTENTCTLTLTNQQEEDWRDFDIIAPVDAPIHAKRPSAEQKIKGDQRFERAKALREQKAASRIETEIKSFLESSKERTDLRRQFLELLTIKDRNDAKLEVWEEHFKYALPFHEQVSEEIYLNYVMNPRVQYEPLMAYRAYITDSLKEKREVFQEDPCKIWTYIKEHITEYPDREYDELITMPAACLKSGSGSQLSQKILFVAIARTFGIPARINPVDQEIEFFKDGKFIPVIERKEKAAYLHIQKDNQRELVYFQDWSIAKKTEGGYQSFHLEEMNWEKDAIIIPVLLGTYRIITSNRLPNGNIFASQITLLIKEKEEVSIVLRMREANLLDMLENNEIIPFTILDENKRKVEASVCMKEKGKSILFWLEDSKEPTEHILNELMEQQEEFDRWQGHMTFIIKDQKALTDPTIAKALKTFPQVPVFYDTFTENVETLARRMYVDPEKLPLILVTDGIWNGIYAASGYNVGTGGMLLRILNLS